MNTKVSKSTQIIDAFLKEHGLTANIKLFPEGTRTSKDAANAIGCDLAQIAKSLIFKTKQTRNPVLILLSGVNRVDEKQIKEEIGEKIIKADAAYTKEKTGFAIGGIPPFAHKEKIRLIFLDRSLLEYETVWAAAGTPNTVFEITPANLLQLSGAKVISVI